MEKLERHEPVDEVLDEKARRELIDRALAEHLPRYAEALERLGRS